MYLNNLFFFLDYNVCNKKLDFVLNELEQNSGIAIDWFQNSYMKNEF